MDYKPLIHQKLKEFSKEFPTMTVGEVLYSTLSVLSKKEGKSEFKKSDLLSVKDKDLYTALCNAHATEKS